MKIDKILEYQKRDFEVIKLERQLLSSEDRKVYRAMIDVVNVAQNNSNALEKEASNLKKEYDNLLKTYNENLKNCNAMARKDLNNVTEADLQNLGKVSEVLIKNLSVIEKKLFNIAERINVCLNQFDATKKKYSEARAKYNDHKQKYDKLASEINPKIEQAKQELQKLESGIDEVLLAKYKQRRADKIFPIYVPLTDKACGGCRMEIPSASLEKLKKDGFLECEHCRRIIYFDEKNN